MLLAASKYQIPSLERQMLSDKKYKKRLEKKSGENHKT
jgi:hypothetical protein